MKPKRRVKLQWGEGSRTRLHQRGAAPMPHSRRISKVYSHADERAVEGQIHDLEVRSARVQFEAL